MKEELSGNLKRGSSTLELLIAFSVLTLSVTAGIVVIFGNQSVYLDTQTNSEALGIAEAMIEKARADSRNDYSSISSANSTEVSGPITYTKSLVVTESGDSKLVTGTVSWLISNKNLAITFKTFLTNFQNLSNACNSTLSGDWTEPEMSTFEFGKDLLVPSDPSSGFPITDVYTQSNKLYVTVNNTHGNNNGTLFGFDISNASQKPQFLFGVDNSTSVGQGLNAVTVSGHYAYVANAYNGSSETCLTNTNCAQLQVIDLNNLTNPPINLKIPAVASGNKLAYGTSIFYSNGYIYLGLAKASISGSEFYVIDVGGGGLPASPTNPLIKGDYQVGNGVNAIFVKNNYAYIASPNAENLTVLDISNPVLPIRVGGYTPAGSNNGESVYVKDNNVYLGRTFGTNEFYLLNSPSGSFIKSKDIGGGSGTSINGLLVRENLMFLITNDEFQIWNTNGTITPYAPDLDLPGGSGTAIGCRGNYIYVGSLPSNDKGFISIVGPKSVYSLANSGDISVIQGQSASNSITSTLVNGFSNNTSFSVSGLPSGASASFINNPCLSTCTSSLTITTTFPTTPVGSYQIIVSDNHGLTSSFNLVVSPLLFDYNLTASKSSLTINRGDSGTNTITVNMIAGTVPQSVSISFSGLQNNVTVSPSPGSCTPSPVTCSVTFTINAASNAQRRTNTITVTGVIPTRTTTFNLTIP